MDNKLRIVEHGGLASRTKWGDGPVMVAVSVFYTHEGHTYAQPWHLTEEFLASEECETVLEYEMQQLVRDNPYPGEAANA